jgi:hypothetical protein
MALKCYDRDFESGNEQKLKDCGRKDDLCVSFYNRETARDEKNKPIPRGWGKSCEKSKSIQFEDFNGDFSERCIESTKGLTSGSYTLCICKTDGCNKDIQL